MKKWWIGYTGSTGEVVQVEVIGQRKVEFGDGMSVVRLPEGIIEDVATSDLYETEAESRRGRTLSEAEDLEGEARGYDDGVSLQQEEVERAMAHVAAYKAKAAELRARAKALRDALTESPDWPTVEAVEGRR